MLGCRERKINECVPFILILHIIEPPSPQSLDIAHFLSYLKRMKRERKLFLYVLLTLGGLIVLFIIGILSFNFIFMPWLVHRGREVEVPSVIGRPFSEAQRILKKSDLLPEVISERPDTLPAGYVVEERPKPGSVVREGRTVELVLSKGLKKLKVPELQGLNLTQAKSIAENLGFRITTIDSEISDSVAEGRILKVSPSSGSSVPAGSGLKITLSLGRKGRFEMPSLVGLKIGDAKRIVKDWGLVMGEIKEITAEGDPGTVLIQSPQYGFLIERGDTVRLIIIEE